MQSSKPVAKAVSQAMMVPLPRPTPTGATPIPPPEMGVGFADFLFVAFFAAALTRFVPLPNVFRRTVVALVVVLGIYMLLVALPGVGSLPALLPMAITVLALHWRHFQYTRSEGFALLYAGLFIAAIAAAFWYFQRQPPEPAESPRAQSMPAYGHRAIV
jgi:hypothetical protein